jgi:hypothetical protein
VPQEPHWRDDVDALAFRPAGHEGQCFVHRLAFRRLLACAPAPDECIAFFDAQADTFQAAAAAKIAGRRLPPDANLHLTSRDLARALKTSSASSALDGDGPSFNAEQ